MKKHAFGKPLVWVIAIIYLFFISIASSQSPIPDVKINNLDEDLRFIPSEENLSVSVQLDTAGRTENADWFVAVNTPQGTFFYTQNGWTNHIAPVVQTALQPLPKINLMDFPASILPSGRYVFYFAVDTEMDGAITWDQLDVDAVTFSILETSLPQDSRFIKASAGGMLKVKNALGDEIILTIPPDSLKESTEITMTALDSTVPSPFASNLLPGVVLSPQGLTFEKPAKIQVNFANSLTEAKSSALFHVKSPSLALPLAERVYSLNRLEADIFHFSTIDAASIATEEEILQAVNVVVKQSREDVDWHDTYATVRSLIEFSYIAEGLGYEEADKQAWIAAKTITSEECADLLAKPVPQEPCGKYKTIFDNLIDLSQRLVLEFCKNEKHYFSNDYIQEQIVFLANQCDNRKIAGFWHFTPSSKNQQCKYFNTVLFPDESLDFPIYDIEISFPRPWDSNYIEAPVTKDLVMTGSWSGHSGEFNLSANTSEISKCGKLYYAYYDTLCEDVINCTLKSCNINLQLNDGKATDQDVTSLEANAYWSYSVTTEVGYPDSRKQVPWVCEGSAFFKGSRIQ